MLMEKASARYEPPTLSALIERHQDRAVPVHELLAVPHLLTRTWDLPKPEWPDLSSNVGSQDLDVAFVLAFLRYVPIEVLRRKDWLLLEHQCAGHECQQPIMVALRLEPNPDVHAAFIEIARGYWGSNLGWGGPPPLAELTRYREVLLPLGLDCNRTYADLREGLYPVDATQEALERAARNPPDLKALTGNRPDFATLCFLAPNSD
jgi:hypothetical protein